MLSEPEEDEEGEPILEEQGEARDPVPEPRRGESRGSAHETCEQFSQGEEEQQGIRGHLDRWQQRGSYEQQLGGSQQSSCIPAPEGGSDGEAGVAFSEHGREDGRGLQRRMRLGS